MGRSDQHVNNPRYVVIPRVLVFLFRNKEVLLIQGSAKKRIWPGRYNGVGGHLERGESLLQAAQRELAEEAGVHDAHLTLCGTIMVDVEPYIGVSVIVFWGKTSKGEITSCDEGKVTWVNIDKLAGLPLVEDLPMILENVIESKKTGKPFSARSFYDSNDVLQMIFSE